MSDVHHLLPLLLCRAQIIGLVVATSHEEAVYAARKVIVSYEDLPAVISIQAAIREGSFYPDKFEIESGSLYCKLCVIICMRRRKEACLLLIFLLTRLLID